ncbi:hypothetical protein BGZ63DRAFT_466340 [Mariannaea sp. PMI_226]|nr:hypothetical protein BGZ63DRAFT_466340 [Mariannaea sp. PMI_226]
MAHIGTTTQSRVRNRSLRTYGKRTLVDTRSEASSKRLRSADEGSPRRTESPSLEEEHRSSSPKSCATTTEDTRSTLEPKIKKGSIMNFFKAVPQPSSTGSSPSIEEVESTSSLPSSLSPPLRVESKRKPRLLRFRGNSVPRLHSDDGGEVEKNEQDEHGNESESGSISEHLNSGKSENAEAQAAGRTRKTRARASPTVQTTLNISSQAAFSECKICNTVWNPLYPDDVKFHKKQHAAVLRKKKKLKEDEL